MRMDIFSEMARKANGRTILDTAMVEIANLREQVEKLKAELKSIDGALNDPRANLTLTTAEIIWELKAQVEKLTKERDKAVRTLEIAGYTDSGGELWKPPLGPSASPLLQQLAALAEQNAKLWRALMKRRYMAPALVDQLLALSLPDLATPVLNKIKAEAYLEAADIAGPEDSHQDEWFKAKADSCAKLRARADELEKTND